MNPTGRFVVGGPKGDAGLTGRKIIVDTYGGIGRHGGGAFSGKDPTKVDRSGAYAARWVAKTIVAAGLASRCEFLLSYAIGVAEPTSIGVERLAPAKFPTSESSRPCASTLTCARRNHRGLEPEAADLSCHRHYGHFGRTDLDAPWEDTSRAAHLPPAAGLEP